MTTEQRASATDPRMSADATEDRILDVCMKSTVNGTATVEDTIAAMTMAMTEHRQSA